MKFNLPLRNERISRRQYRPAKGSITAELPVVLWVIFVAMTIPLVAMVSFSIRYNFLVAASRDAAYTASRATTYAADVSPSELSAVHSADAAARVTASKFSEITVNSVSTNIIITRLSTGVITRQNQALAQPADTSTYVYQIETVVNGSTTPLLALEECYWNRVPGLTAPINVSIASKAYFENPQGLNQ